MAAGDLARRVAVAAVGIPVAVAVVYAGGWVLGVVLALIAAGAAVELYRLSTLQGARPFVVPGAVVSAALVVLATLYGSPREAAPALWALLLLTTLALSAAAIWARGAEGLPLEAVAITLFGALLTGGGLAYAVFLRALPVPTLMLAEGGGGAGPDALGPRPWAGTALVFFALVLTWVNDAAAYFAGRAWGRRKLIPAVSPGKTVVGAVAGLIATPIAGALWAALVFRSWLSVPFPVLAGAVGGLLISIMAQVGDLAESLVKREAGVKDSGRLLPGHGGLYDRFDALIFTLPTAYWFVRVLLPLLGGTAWR